jgi:predicted ATPase/DNA-binding winged helix-turn-helix (wHTH) protein
MIKIGRVDVSLELRQLFLNGQPLRVGTRAFDILELLIDANGQLVSKEALFAHVWPKTVVEESNLQVQISALRKLLGDDKDLLKTVPGLGYRLACESDTESRVTKPRHAPELAEHHHQPHNIPLACAPLIGREQALMDVQMALGSAPLVTLVGTGGIGKTQLGLEVARAQLASFDTVRHVNLSSVEREESTLGAICNALESACPEGETSLEPLIRSIGLRDLLIVLDNCEHVIQQAATICEALIQANPHLRILATSREPLRARFEQVYRVPPLDVPPDLTTDDDVLRCSAVQMFLSRTRACDPNFRTDSNNIRLIGTICRRLDGVPLALELAAARVTTLGMGELAAQLDDRFRILTDGLRTAPARQQTLKAALDWSYRFLCSRERTVLRRIGIFHGNFPLSAACAIAALEDLSTEDVTEAIAGLVSKSLLMFGSNGAAMNYHLLETTRAYALQMLAEAGESEAMLRQHENYARAQGAATWECGCSRQEVRSSPAETRPDHHAQS